MGQNSGAAVLVQSPARQFTCSPSTASPGCQKVSKQESGPVSSPVVEGATVMGFWRAGVHRYTWLTFVFLAKMCFHHVGQACLKLLTSARGSLVFDGCWDLTWPHMSSVRGKTGSHLAATDSWLYHMHTCLSMRRQGFMFINSFGNHSWSQEGPMRQKPATADTGLLQGSGSDAANELCQDSEQDRVLLLLLRLECNSEISVHCNLCLGVQAILLPQPPRRGFTMLVRLVSNSSPQVIRSPWPPKVLGLHVRATAPSLKDFTDGKYYHFS
ncbi:hypothetical protein AAY473_001262, partial [Plecturocebus cupreus]